MVTIRPTAHPRYNYETEWYSGTLRKRKFFPTKREAEAFATVIRTELAQMAPAEDPITADERAAVMLARRNGVALDAAVRDFMRRRRGAVAVPTLAELISQRLDEVKRAKRATRYQAELGRYFETLQEAVGGGTLVDGIGSNQLSGFIYGPHAAATTEKRRLVLYGLFESAKKRRQIDFNPVAELQSVSPDVDAEVGILTPWEAQELWMACEEVAPAMLPALAIGLWAGLRMAEIGWLEWESIRPRTGVIHVKTTKSKTRQRRLVTIEQPLRNVLESRMQTEGNVWPANGRKLWDSVRAAAGWKCRRVAKGRTWPHNALRHSFVTYHLAQYQDAAKTALEAGHSQDVLFAHYRELVTADEAAIWWGGWTLSY